jgi:TonB family protein
MAEKRVTVDGPREPAAAAAPPSIAIPSRPARGPRPRVQHSRIETPSMASAAARSSDTTYYTIRQLDIYPIPTEPLHLTNLTPAMPGDVSMQAVIELHISDTGVVDSAKVLEAHPSGAFEAALTATLLATRFTPAMRDGRNVRSRVLVRMD